MVIGASSGGSDMAAAASLGPAAAAAARGGRAAAAGRRAMSPCRYPCRLRPMMEPPTAQPPPPDERPLLLETDSPTREDEGCARSISEVTPTATCDLIASRKMEVTVRCNEPTAEIDLILLFMQY